MTFIKKKMLTIGLFLTLTTSSFFITNIPTTAHDCSFRSAKIVKGTGLPSIFHIYAEEYVTESKYYILDIVDLLKKTNSDLNEFEINFILNIIEKKILEDSSEEGKKFNKNLNFYIHGWTTQDNKTNEPTGYINFTTDPEKPVNKGFCFQRHVKEKVNEITKKVTYEFQDEKKIKQNLNDCKFLTLLKNSQKSITKEYLKLHLEKTIQYLKKTKALYEKPVKELNKDEFEKNLKNDWPGEILELKTIDKEIYKEIKDKLLKSVNSQDNRDLYNKFKNILKNRNEEWSKMQKNEAEKLLDKFTKIKNSGLDKILEVIKNTKFDIDFNKYKFKEYTENHNNLDKSYAKLLYDVINLIKNDEEIKKRYSSKLNELKNNIKKEEKEIAKLGQKYLEEEVPGIINRLEKFSKETKEELKTAENEEQKKYLKNSLKKIEKELKYARKNPKLPKQVLKYTYLLKRVWEKEVYKTKAPFFEKFIDFANKK